MLDFFNNSILSIGIYFYFIPIVLGFFIFEHYSSPNYYAKRDKNLSLGGLFFILTFIFVEYFSETNIHFVSDIILSLETGNLQFDKEIFTPLVLISSVVVMLFWLPALFAILLAFIVSLAFPKAYIDFGFFIFIITATLQTIHLIRESHEETYYSSSFHYEEYMAGFLAILSSIVKILKILS
jgi:hypothetical protein